MGSFGFLWASGVQCLLYHGPPILGTSKERIVALSYTGAGGMFTRLGKLFHAIATLNTARKGQPTPSL